jgi:lambda family phage minor tail protein L
MAYTAWQASNSYAVGNIVRATAVQDFGLVFQCITAGTSGATQPAWPTLIDSTTVDGSVTWTAISAVYEDLSVLAPNAIIELFQLHLDATLHGTSDIYYFHNGANAAVTGNIIWNGQSYVRLPIEATGFDYSSTGSLPRPTLVISNIGSSITAILLSINLITPGNDLGGAKVVRVRTLKKYLDGAAGADPHAKFPDEVWYVDRKANENRATVEFELASRFDLAGVMLPRRQIIANICQWQYRSGECGYTGIDYYDTNDNAVASSANDVCGKRVSSCNARFAPFALTGSVTVGSSTLNLASATIISAGTPVAGFGIPASTTVSSSSGSAITLSQAATATSNVTTNGTLQTNITQIIVSSATGLATGMAVSGPYLSAGTTVLAIAGSTVTITQPATSAIVYTAITTRTASGSNVPLVTFSFIKSSLDPYAMGLSSGTTTGLSVGMRVMGQGLPSDYSTQITQILSSTIMILSYARPYVSGTFTYTFYTRNIVISPGAYTFTGNNRYVFRNSSPPELPFGSFPGAGLIQ